MDPEAVFGSLYNNSVPFRYSVESDSEDEGFDDPDAGVASFAAPKRSQSNECHVQVNGSLSKGKQVWIALDDPGEVWSNGLRGFSDSGNAMVNDAQVAGMAELPDGILVSCASTHLPLSHLYPLADSILSHLAPSRLSIIDSYAVESYLTQSQTGTPTIRSLHTANHPDPGAPAHEVPNLISGLGAALLLAAFQQTIPAQLQLLPTLSDRPEGIYDPTPMSRLASSDSILVQTLVSAAPKTLHWPASWTAKPLGSTHVPWLWKRRQERLRQQKGRGERGLDSMYL